MLQQKNQNRGEASPGCRLAPVCGRGPRRRAWPWPLVLANSTSLCWSCFSWRLHLKEALQGTSMIVKLSSSCIFGQHVRGHVWLASQRLAHWWPYLVLCYCHTTCNSHRMYFINRFSNSHVEFRCTSSKKLIKVLFFL